MRSLSQDSRFPEELVKALEPLPGFRKVLVHEYAKLDLNRVIEALDRLAPIQEFLQIVARVVAEPDQGPPRRDASG